MRQQRIDRRIALGLFALGFALLLATEGSVGFVRDESVYFYAGSAHARWVGTLFSDPVLAVSAASIDRDFAFNHEHPALMKTLFGISHAIFHDTLHWMRPAAAFRLPAFVLSALTLTLIYALARRRCGRIASVFAALTWLAVPRQFFHEHLACFDAPMAFMWLLVVWCWLKARDAPRYWLYTGLAFGAALATKLNAFFIPVALAPFGLWRVFLASKGKDEARRLAGAALGAPLFAMALIGGVFLVLGQASFLNAFEPLSGLSAILILGVGATCVFSAKLAAVDATTFRAVAPLVAMAVLGPLVFYVHWPWLWFHPIARVGEYVGFHLHHIDYPWMYLGQLLLAPPFPLAYVLAVTALTVPTSLFALMVLGTGSELLRLIRRRASEADAIILGMAAFSIALISLPSVPHFGGVKHWLPSMPFLGILAAYALERGAVGLAALVRGETRRAQGLRSVIPYALTSLVLLPAAIATARYFPYGTSYYSELAGGLPGAATLGMQRQYWANNVTGVLPWINANARPGERVYLHENHSGQVADYIANGMVRKDLQFVGSIRDADIVAYQYHQEFRDAEFQTWQLINPRPAFGLYVDETPQVIVYRRRSSRAAPAEGLAIPGGGLAKSSR